MKSFKHIASKFLAGVLMGFLPTIAFLQFFGISTAVAFTTECTGGTITHVGGYTIHTFTTNGTLDCTGTGGGNVSALVVGGGGGGGNGWGGGGGGGGVVATSSMTLGNTSYAITVGAGGDGTSGGGTGNNGSSSSLGSLLSANGGGGGNGVGASGGPFGSGGGGNSNGSGYNNGASGTSGQGNNGGDGVANGSGSGGGGGGARATGGAASGGTGGAGGAGYTSIISGSSETYGGGGGGGGGSTGGAGGAGGGGVGGSGSGAGSAGIANTGGGGGGGGNSNSGAGGSGVVIVSYPDPVMLTALKISDQIVTNSTTLQNDSALKLSLAANDNYIIDGTLFVTSSSSPDIVIEFTAPSGAVLTLGYQSGADQGVLTAGTASSRIVIPTPNTPGFIRVSGTVQMPSSGGAVQLEWAQATAASAGTAVQAGSYLRADQI